MLLYGQFNLSTFILGKPGTCQKIGKFQCNNGKCILKDSICNFNDECGDNSDELKTDEPFCGMLIDSLGSLTKMLSLLYQNFENNIKINIYSLRETLGR